MTIENFRLRIELNSIIKFYVKINTKCLLSDLKKLISSILSKNYGISLPSYSLRSVDGFEILDIFRLCDILDDNQILVIDAFTNTGRSRNSSDKMNSTLIENSVDKVFERINDKSNRRERSEFYDQVPAVKPLKSQVDQEMADTNHNTPAIHSRVEIPAVQPVATEVKVEKRVIGKPSLKLQKVEEQKSEKVEETTSLNTDESKLKRVEKYENSTIIEPPRPENFKGFVIKKTDLNKKQTVLIDDSSFKPLKKRKVEIEEFDLN